MPVLKSRTKVVRQLKYGGMTIQLLCTASGKWMVRRWGYEGPPATGYVNEHKKFATDRDAAIASYEALERELAVKVAMHALKVRAPREVS